MKNELSTPLHSVIQATDALLVDAALNPPQNQCVRAIRQVSDHLINWVSSIPDSSWKSARETLDFETRSHLASIIGYAEILLDQDDGPLTDDEQQLVHQIRAAGKSVLSRLSKEE